MVYVQYEHMKIKYLKAQSNYEELIKEKENLFAITQPTAQKLDREKVLGGKTENAFDKYMVRKEDERIEERLAEARTIVADRKYLLDLKRTELEESNDVYDKVYYLKYIKRNRVRQIANKINYSQAQTNRLIKEIRETINRINYREF